MTNWNSYLIKMDRWVLHHFRKASALSKVSQHTAMRWRMIETAARHKPQLTKPKLESNPGPSNWNHSALSTNGLAPLKIIKAILLIRLLRESYHSAAMVSHTNSTESLSHLSCLILQATLYNSQRNFFQSTTSWFQWCHISELRANKLTLTNYY